jgi:PAS domain S-box-containing protein
MIKDITELQENRRKLQHRTDELMSLADNAPDLIYRMDRSLRHTFVNQRLVEITGIPRNEYEGKTNRELGMPADHCDTWDEIQSQVFRTGRPVVHEFSYDTLGGPRLYHARIVPEFDDEGRVETILGIVRDITEYEDARLRLQQAYDQLRRNREDLAAKNRAMREVLDKIEEDRQRVRQNIATNVELSIAPTLERLRHQIDPSLIPQLDLVEEQLTDLASSFYSRLQARFTRLSPRELEICQMIRHGMSSKEIAGSLNVSLLTIHKHREQIRSKLGLTGKTINLSSYLQNF